MTCKKCGAKIIEGNSFCIQCGEPYTDEEKLKEINVNQEEHPTYTAKSQNKNDSTNKKTFVMIMGILCAVFLIIGIVSYSKGFNVKNNYYNSDSSFENAYVGGDAYNYIINGTYFTGYVAIGSVSILSSVVCLGTAFIIAAKKEQGDNMYCGKCGTKLDDGQTFCQNCGAKISKSDIKRSLKGNKSKIIISVVIAFVVIACIGIFFAAFKATAFSGKYQYMDTVSSADNSDYWEFTPSGTNTGEYSWYTGKIVNVSGTYSVKGNILTTDNHYDPPISYIIYKNYLFETEDKFDGQIPESKTFDIECKKDDFYEPFRFKSDGTAEYMGYKGTYKREGDVITFTYKYNLVEHIDKYIVYKGQLYEGKFVKIKN